MRKVLTSMRLKGNNVLVVVAHPDDESLYFFGGLKLLSQFSNVTVLCVTHPKNSERGAEFLEACLSLQVRCEFLEMSDDGIDTLLPDFQKELSRFLLNKQFDLIVTHPPHGGEKPHPHHLQIFLAVFQRCLNSQIRFAFFSECERSLCRLTNNRKYLHLPVSALVRPYTIQLFTGLRLRSRFQWFSSVGIQLWTLIMQMINQRVVFSRIEIEVPLQEKQKALRHYTTQRSVLEMYRSANSDKEYLFFMKNWRLLRARQCPRPENDLTSYYEYKATTQSGLTHL